MTKRLYDPPLRPADDASTDAIAWWAEYERACYLLESLAEDVFTDQQAFDVWISRQMALALRKDGK